MSFGLSGPRWCCLGVFWSSVDVARVFATVLVPLAAVAHSTTTRSLGGIIAFLVALVLVLWRLDANLEGHFFG